MNPILLGGLAGIGAGGVLLLLSHIAPTFGARVFVRDTDEPRVFGRSVSRREAHLLGILLHLALSFVFGALFTLGVQEGVVSGYGVVPLAAYALAITIFNGGVVLPLEGHGLFGVKEDPWFPVDLLVTNILWVILYGIVIRLWA